MKLITTDSANLCKNKKKLVVCIRDTAGKIYTQGVLRYLQGRWGVSLIEVLITLTILAVVITGLLQVFIYASSLSSLSRNMTLATSEAQQKIEEIRNTPFSAIVGLYSGDIFTFSSLVNGVGVVSINAANPSLLDIEVGVGWKDKNGRVVGEDANLDGVFDIGTEDANGNGQMDYPVVINTLLAER